MPPTVSEPAHIEAAAQHGATEPELNHQASSFQRHSIRRSEVVCLTIRFKKEGDSLSVTKHRDAKTRLSPLLGQELGFPLLQYSPIDRDQMLVSAIRSSR